MTVLTYENTVKVPFVIIQNDKYQGSFYLRISFLENCLYGDGLFIS